MKIIEKRFATIDSTNTYAKEHISEFERGALTIVIADSQTRGRGRSGRSWVAPPNVNLYLTYCSYLPKPFSHLHNCSQILAISAYETLCQLGFEPRLKWPNDLMLNGKKIAGVLAEISSIGDEWFLASGIGLNINMSQELLTTIPQPATSLYHESGKQWDRELILKNLTEHYVRNMRTFAEKGFNPFLPLFKDMLAYDLNQPIRFHVKNQIYEGQFHSVASDGSLKMILNDGKVAIFSSGEEAKGDKDGAKTTIDGAKTTIDGAKTTIDDPKTSIDGSKDKITKVKVSVKSDKKNYVFDGKKRGPKISKSKNKVELE